MANAIGAHGTILDHLLSMNEIKKLFSFHNLNLYMPLDVGLCNWLYCNAL
jgi:hypothetical protein